MTDVGNRYPNLQPGHEVVIDPDDGRQIVVCPFPHEGTDERVTTPWAASEPVEGVSCVLCEALTGHYPHAPAHTHGPHDATTPPESEE